MPERTSGTSTSRRWRSNSGSGPHHRETNNLRELGWRCALLHCAPGDKDDESGRSAAETALDLKGRAHLTAERPATRHLKQPLKILSASCTHTICNAHCCVGVRDRAVRARSPPSCDTPATSRPGLSPALCRGQPHQASRTSRAALCLSPSICTARPRTFLPLLLVRARTSTLHGQRLKLGSRTRETRCLDAGVLEVRGRLAWLRLLLAPRTRQRRPHKQQRRPPLKQHYFVSP